MRYLLNSNLTQLSTLAAVQFDNLPWWIWVVAAAVVVLLVASITAIAVSKRKSHAKNKIVNNETSVENNEVVEEQKPEVIEDEPELIEETEAIEESEQEEESTSEPIEESEPLPVEEIEEETETVEEIEEEVIETVEEVEETESEEADIVETVEIDEIDEEEQNESTIKFVNGYGIVVRYNKSYKARLIQSADELKNNYSALKNELLSYKKVKSRTSWNYESLNAGRSKIAKFNVRGKTLKLYLALNPDDYADTKYKVERADSKRYEEVPCLYRITNPRRLKYAMDLIADAAEKHGLIKGVNRNENFSMPYESTEELIEEALIKELVSQAAYDEYMRRKNQAEVDKIHRNFVSAAEVNAIISDEVAVSLVEDARKVEEPVDTTADTVVKVTPTRTGKKGIINIDVLSSSFDANDVVSIETLKAKGLINKNIGYVKVLARGVLNKPLNVELQDYSIEAVKMIVLTGGKVKRV